MNCLYLYQHVLTHQKQKAKSQEIKGDDEDLGIDEEHAESNISESEWNKYMWKFDVLVLPQALGPYFHGSPVCYSCHQASLQSLASNSQCQSTSTAARAISEVIPDWYPGPRLISAMLGTGEVMMGWRNFVISNAPANKWWRDHFSPPPSPDGSHGQ